MDSSLTSDISKPHSNWKVSGIKGPRLNPMESLLPSLTSAQNHVGKRDTLHLQLKKQKHVLNISVSLKL